MNTRVEGFFIPVLIERKEIKLFFLRHGYLLITAAWLITIAFLANNYWLYSSAPKGVRTTLENSIRQKEQHFEDLASDWPLMEKLLRRSYDQEELGSLLDKKLGFYFYVFDEEWEAFWNTDLSGIDPDPSLYQEGSSLVRLNSGYYELIKRRIGGAYPGNQYALGLIPIRITYFTSNEYLPDEFFGKPLISKKYTITTADTGLPVKNREGKTLFYLEYVRGHGQGTHSLVSAILKILAAICVLIFLNLIAVFFVTHVGRWYGFIFLILVIGGLRVISYIYAFPIHFSELGLFNPRLYSSGLVQRSLGDLFINIILLFWIILFFREHFSDIKIHFRNRVVNYLLAALFCLALFLTADFFSHWIRSLVTDSNISFDVTNFFSLSWYSFVGFITIGVIVFSFFFFSRIVNRILVELIYGQSQVKYALLAIVGLVWMLLRMQSPDLGFSLVLMVWLIVYIILMDIIGQKITDAFSTQPFIFFLLVLTVTITGILVYYNYQQEKVNREAIARRIAEQTDQLTPPILAEKFKMVQSDPMVVAFFTLKTPKAKSLLVEHLQEDYFSGFLSNFDIRVFTFDEDGSPLFNKDTGDIFSLNNIINLKSRPTSVPDLYYYVQSFNTYTYIDKKDIFDTTLQQVSGYLFFFLTPKVLKAETLYPALLVERNMTPMLYSGSYSYAVYHDLNLINHYNDYPFQIRLNPADLPQTRYTFTQPGGYSILWYRPNPDMTILLVKKNPNLLEIITLFAYMFCIFLLIAGFYRLLDLTIRARMKWTVFRRLLEINIRRQVHGTIIFIVVFAFLILAATTISFFIGRYDKTHRDQLSTNVNSVAAEITGGEFMAQNGRDTGDIFTPELHEQLAGYINNIADLHGVDINLYDLDGNLQVTSQPLIYEEHLLSSKINPEAYYQLNFLNRVQFIQSEQIGRLNYLSGYMPIRTEEGKSFAYLNIPYFASQDNLNQEISNFLVTLINLNAFIFLLSGMLALIITNSITRSFGLIGEKLKEVNLLKGNNPIEWKRNDEIGMLVREYNNMVRKLEVSAASMAKSEREGAWREMAKQVAHEIKNPLTSMKLSLQYLQKAIQEDSTQLHSMSENVSKTLIEQIEHLSKIAEDFAAFANISPSRFETILLNEVLNSVITLYQVDQRYIILYDAPEKLFYVFADKTEMNRLFTNLLQNAVQSIPEDRRGYIEIEAHEKEHTVHVTIRDNGTGIAENIRSRIFMPNFTTKNSGTGLGLAMCRNIVEHAHGEIWFETVVGKGTEFHVQLPLVEPEAQ